MDVAVAVARSARRGGVDETTSSREARDVSSASASASLEVLIRLVARAASDPAAKAALLEAPDGGAERGSAGSRANAFELPGGPPRAASSAFAPVAGLLEGPRSAQALELLRRVAELGEGVDASPSAPSLTLVADEDAASKYGAAATLGAPSAMWNSVDANGGRAVDLMYGVAASGRIDPNQAAPPACLVGDSADAGGRR